MIEDRGSKIEDGRGGSRTAPTILHSPSSILALLAGALRFYKRFISPLLPPACRFHPTCSEYAQEALEKHGVVKGLWKALFRLLRCHPFSRGGYDPVA